MKSYECLDLEKIKALATTVNTGKELVEKLQHEMKENSLMKSFRLDFHKIRDLAISAHSMEDMIGCLRMDIELLEEMKADGVILLFRYWEGEIWDIYYFCTINPQVSEKYDFVLGIYDVTEEFEENVIEEIQAKLDSNFKREDDFYTYSFTMRILYEVDSMDTLISFIRRKADLLTSMNNDGVYLPKDFVSQDSGEHWIKLSTKDPDVARKYDFYEYSSSLLKSDNDSKYYLSISLDELLV